MWNVLVFSDGSHTSYQQIPVKEEDKPKTGFITDSGLYEYNEMAFGLKNASETFQRFMDNLFAGLKWKLVFSLFR